MQLTKVVYEDYLFVANYVELYPGISQNDLWEKVRNRFSDNWWRYQDALKKAEDVKEIRRIESRSFSRMRILYVPGLERGWSVSIN